MSSLLLAPFHHTRSKARMVVNCRTCFGGEEQNSRGLAFRTSDWVIVIGFGGTGTRISGEMGTAEYISSMGCVQGTNEGGRDVIGWVRELYGMYRCTYGGTIAPAKQ